MSKQIEELTIDGVEVDIHSLASELIFLSIDLPFEDCEEEDNYIPVRLQIVNGSWELHSGDAQYDTDHRGYWGASCIDNPLDEEQALDLAQELIDEALDHFAELNS